MARLLAHGGWHVGALDLSREALVQMVSEWSTSGGGSLSTYAGDVTDASFVSVSLAQFAQTHGGVDLVVNNAGVAVAGPVEATPVEDWRWIVDVNLLGVVWGCRAALPLLRRQGNGLVLNIASSAGFAAAPQMSAYNATKAAVIALSETLVGELHGSGVQVSVAMPGFFQTRLLDRLRAPSQERALAQHLMGSSGHDADEAAHALLAAAAAGDTYIVWPPPYRLAWRLKRLFPRWFLRRVRTFRDAQLRRTGPRPG